MPLVWPSNLKTKTAQREWSTGDLSVPGRWPLRLFPPPPRDGVVARATESAQVRPPPVARSGGDEYLYLQPPGVLRHRPTNRKAPAPAASAIAGAPSGATNQTATICAARPHIARPVDRDTDEALRALQLPLAEQSTNPLRIWKNTTDDNEHSFCTPTYAPHQAPSRR
ncbi:hypothetical protein B0T13DRAFT_449793 [Neurospora crassa]|nr:hypothetical protein B0T13DRAFT_449793 [Neurospora crassa]